MEINGTTDTLSLSSLPAGILAARNARATAYMQRTGNADLLEALGLVQRPSAGPRSATCPACDAQPGDFCHKQSQEGATKRFHRARYKAVGAVRS